MPREAWVDVAVWQRGLTPGPAPVALALSALAHPVRHRLLELLATRGETGVAEVRSALSLAKPAVVYHARILLTAGLIDVRRRGRTLSYVLRPAAVAELRDALAALAAPPVR
ncbi:MULTISPECIES: ArsR/SmtB family transcription factor [unclassified Blastococcus]